LNTDQTWGEVELHLLVTAISPQLREYISTNAKASVKAPKHQSKVFVFSALQDKSMVKEMDSLCRDASAFVSKRCETIKDITSYNVNERLVEVIEQVQTESKADRAECEKRLAKRQRFLQSMLLFDIIGSVENVNPVVRLSSNPGFTVEIEDVWNDNTTATMSLVDGGLEPESFTVSQRTLVMLRKIVQPLADAKSAYFEFTKTGACNMRLRGTPPAREFIRKAARAQEA
jgi:hypothetical protein